MTISTYNGWNNRETWLVNLWLTNDEGTYWSLEEIAQSNCALYEKADQLKEFVYELCMWSESIVNGRAYGLVCDIVNQSLGNVDYREIIMAFIGE